MSCHDCSGTLQLRIVNERMKAATLPSITYFKLAPFAIRHSLSLPAGDIRLVRFSLPKQGLDLPSCGPSIRQTLHITGLSA